MQPQPLVSVIIPVYNGECYLAQAIESVFAQTYRPIELIVVDDGSTDGSAGIAKSYLEIRYLHQANQGSAAAENAGIQAAHGQLLALLDADDVWEPNKLELQVHHLIEHRDIDYNICRARFFFEPGTGPPSWLNKELLKETPPLYTVSALVVRTRTMNEIGHFDSRYRHAYDLDWFLRAKDAGTRMAIVPEPLVHYRIHSANLSRATQTMAAERMQALKASIDRKQGRTNGKG